MELRTDDSPDVVPYTFQKNMETVVVPIGEKLMEIRERYIQVDFQSGDNYLHSFLITYILPCQFIGT